MYVRHANKLKIGQVALPDGAGRNVVCTLWTFLVGDMVHGERDMIQAVVTLVIGNDFIHKKLRFW